MNRRILMLATVVCCLSMSIVRAQDLGKPEALNPELSVAAIAGNPVVSQAAPVLNVSAIARATSLCTCDGCTLKTPHVCGAPGCTCAAGCVCEPMPDLNLAAMSPQRKPKPTEPKAVTVTKPKEPKYQWQQVCNGRFCSWQMVRIQ